MIIQPMSKDQEPAVIGLFDNVFNESESEEEGRVVSALVHDVLNKTALDDWLAIVAIEENKVIACIILTRLIVEPAEAVFLLSPVAVDTSYQRQGVGQKLIKYGLSQLNDNHVNYLVTYGDPDYYQKIGFQGISQESVKPPFPLSQPEGWLGRSVPGGDVKLTSSKTQCVEAFNNAKYW